MLQKYSFIPVFCSLLCGLSWLSVRVESSVSKVGEGPALAASTIDQGIHRIDLIEVLDKAAAYEHYYHSVYGHYTKLLSKIGFNIPIGLTSYYDIRVSEATADRLLITSFSEMNGKTLDVASIDQDYQIHANFDMPPPRAAYLKLRAIRQMRVFRDAPMDQTVVEEGVFKGYFQYIVKANSQNERTVRAVGVLSPVQGVQLEVNSKSEGETEVDLEATLASNESPPVLNDRSLILEEKTGQLPVKTVTHLEEEAFLAQHIFYGEVGRYAKSWSELSKIANFRFEGKDQFGNDPKLILEGGGKSPSLFNRKVSSELDSKRPLEVEAISPNESL